MMINRLERLPGKIRAVLDQHYDIDNHLIASTALRNIFSAHFLAVT
jgi:hypothetical protein